MARLLIARGYEDKTSLKRHARGSKIQTRYKVVSKDMLTLFPCIPMHEDSLPREQQISRNFLQPSPRAGGPGPGKAGYTASHSRTSVLPHHLPPNYFQADEPDFFQRADKDDDSEDVHPTRTRS